MKSTVAQVVVLACSVWITAAQADWIVVGAEYKCDKNNKSLSLRGVVDTSMDGGVFPPLDGYQRLGAGDTSIRCAFGSTFVRAKVSVIPPQERGCMGSGAILLNTFFVNGRSVFGRSMEFNTSACLKYSEPSLHEILVSERNGKAILRTCRGVISGAGDYRDDECQDVSLTTQRR